MAKQKRFSRRDFLKAMGSASVYLPVLPSLLPTLAQAQATTPPRRVIFIMNRNGQTADAFYPNLTTAQIQPNLYSGALSSMSGNISGVFGTAFNSLKSKVSILQGLDVIGANDHCRSSFLCAVTQAGVMGAEGNNTPWGASTDWIMERSSNFYPSNPRIPALRFSNGGGRGFSFSNIGGVIDDPPYSGSDSSFFNNTFAGFQGGGGTGGVDPLARKSFLIDRAIERLGLLSTNSRLSRVDSQRVAEHVSNLSDIKSGLVITTPTACTVPSTPSFYSQGDLIRKKYQNVFDTVVAAFTCDISRIACVYIEDYHDAQTDYSYFHDISHQSLGAGHTSSSSSTNGWIADRIAYLLNKLDTTIDTNGRPMLENTLVLWGSEICVKQGQESHRGESMPVLVAGWPDKFRMGTFIDFRTRPFQHVANRGDFPAIGRPYAQFLSSIMMAAGLQKSEFQQYGRNGYFGEFVRTQYNPNFYDNYATVRNDYLPYFVL